MLVYDVAYLCAATGIPYKAEDDPLEMLLLSLSQNPLQRLVETIQKIEHC